MDACLLSFFSVKQFLFLILQEVIRIKNEHPDDKNCILNDRVKGRLKVTRAFGAGFLKQVLWMFLLIALINFTFCMVCR